MGIASRRRLTSVLALCLTLALHRTFVPAPTSLRPRSARCPAHALATEVAQAEPREASALVSVGAVAGLVASEALAAPWRPSLLWGLMQGPVVEDVFLLLVAGLSIFSLSETATMQMRCPHAEARVHTVCNALATVCSLYGMVMEWCFRESPGLWWGVLTPALYLVSNLTMSQLMKMYKGPEAYRRLFDLGQSFTLSFQGIHLLSWSSLYPCLYWAAMPFWYWSIKKLLEPLAYLQGVAAGENASRLEVQKRQAWGSFGLEMDAMTLGFMLANFVAAIADNVYMATYTIRGPEGFFEVSRALSETAGGSDHLRMALVKPAVGSLVVSLAVFLGTLVSRKRVPFNIGVPASALLSTLGPWLVFFWHRLVDPAEPWLPELMGSSWGPGPLAKALGG